MSNLEKDLRFEEFYLRECRGLYRYVYLWVGNHDDAIEIIQESFWSLYQSQVKVVSPAYERPLLYRIARNQAFDVLRRRRTRENHDQEITASNVIPFRVMQEPTPEEALLEKERQEYAAAAFASLGKRDQECLALRRSGLSYKAVAEIMSINPISVGRIINRALKRYTQSYNAYITKPGVNEQYKKTK